jgi:acetylornithine deacetylase/succinyl-diaminopimelate desuccinylase-like protein
LVERMLRQAGCQPWQDDVGNVLCVCGELSAPAVVFAAHLDTVFGLDQPIEIVHDEENGRMVGPGIGDNALGVAALLHLARRFAGRCPSKPLVLAATVGEEGLGDLRGAKQLLSDIPSEVFVALEGAGLDILQISGVASVRCQVRYMGPGGHSWNDRGTPSAIHGLADRTASFLSQHGHSDVSVNVGCIRGGTSINTIASEAELELDLRSLEPDALGTVAKHALEHFGEPPDGLEASFEVVGERPGGSTPPEHWVVEAARNARKAVGLEPAREESFSTDANAAYGRGIPAIGVGVSTGGNAHRPNDYIDVEPLGQGLRALDLLAESLVQAHGVERDDVALGDE